MRKLHLSIILAGFIAAQPVFADSDYDMGSENKDCATIVNACLGAGFTRGPDASKKFWKDCMKPIIMGKSVQGVNVDAATVKSCRTNKIAHMKKELQEMQSVKGN